ncbi:MAG: hypothetical protein DRI34_10645 [Deltaproteobacteria bacterium]|nr:MAG: hypothetical protein DRI34_10645 [Deltaproteobacteria bacterium]
MNLTGDAVGLVELKKIKEERKDFLRFLITEAKTSFARRAEFRGRDGRRWYLYFDGQRNELRVEPARTAGESSSD